MREFSNKNEKGEVGATKPQAASYAATSPPLPASQVGDQEQEKRGETE